MGFLDFGYEDNITGKDGRYKGRGIGAAIPTILALVDEEAIKEASTGN